MMEYICRDDDAESWYRNHGGLMVSGNNSDSDNNLLRYISFMLEQLPGSADLTRYLSYLPRIPDL